MLEERHVVLSFMDVYMLKYKQERWWRHGRVASALRQGYCIRLALHHAYPHLIRLYQPPHHDTFATIIYYIAQHWPRTRHSPRFWFADYKGIICLHMVR